MKPKITVVYNFAQRYRLGIFELIDKTFDVQWCFGNNRTDIKEIDILRLKSVKQIKNIYIYKSLSWQKGIVMDYLTSNNDFIILGDLFCISTWGILFLHNILKTKNKVYLWSHGWYGKESSLRYLLKKLYFSMSDKTFLYGNYAKKVARAHGYNHDNLVVIHNSLDYTFHLQIRNQLYDKHVLQSHFGNDYHCLIFIGRLTSTKRIDLLIHAVKKLHDKSEMFNLTIVGDGEYANLLKEQVCSLGLSNHVWFYGECYDEELNAQLIYESDLCVSPGNVGLTAIHSMTFGTPVLTHNEPKWQMPEFESIKEGITGGFFQKDSIESLADSILDWFGSNNYDRETIRKQCMKTIDDEWNPNYQIKFFQDIIK